MEKNEYMIIVDELNEFIYDKLGGEAPYSFFYEYHTYSDCIKFGDLILWDSENDGREWDDIQKEYESLKDYLLIILKKYLDDSYLLFKED